MYWLSLIQSENEVAQSCPTLYDPMDCSLPGSYIHEIFQVRILESVAISFSRGLGLEWVNLMQMTIISTTAGRSPSEEMEQPSWSTRVRNAVVGCNLKNDRMISVRFQGKSFNIMVTQVYAPMSNAEEAEVDWFCEDLQTF